MRNYDEYILDVVRKGLDEVIARLEKGENAVTDYDRQKTWLLSWRVRNIKATLKGISIGQPSYNNVNFFNWLMAQPDSEMKWYIHDRDVDLRVMSGGPGR
jgi:hypothetical protein